MEKASDDVVAIQPHYHWHTNEFNGNSLRSAVLWLVFSSPEKEREKRNEKVNKHKWRGKMKKKSESLVRLIGLTH